MIALLLTGITATSFAAGPGKIGERQHMLRREILRAQYTGAISHRQARLLNNERKSISREIHADRAAHGGRLNRAEKFAVAQQQKQLRHQIYFVSR